MAIGIGASTAVFSVVDAMLLNPLPFPRAERIVTVWQFDATAAVEREVSPGNETMARRFWPNDRPRWTTRRCPWCFCRISNTRPVR